MASSSELQMEWTAVDVRRCTLMVSGELFVTFIGMIGTLTHSAASSLTMWVVWRFARVCSGHAISTFG